ncbi:MAG: CpsD/CapB family tyrosine-protein kinase [Candidatus Thiodiazotropha sp.]
MEKIKQALDRAGVARAIEEKDIKRHTLLQHTSDSDEMSRIIYTTTKTFKISKDKLREQRVIASDSNDYITDQYKVLRTQVLQRLKTNHWNSLAVTSPNEGSGKTLTAINLAISLAKEVNHSVLLVDMDLRRPTIHNYFFYERQLGISEYLTGNNELSEILVNPGIDRLVILPGNESFANSSEMLSTPKMVRLVEELKSRYPNRIVIYDMPPLLSCDDMIAFAPYVDAVMLVVEDESTRKDELKRSFDLIKNYSVIGTVLNKSKVTRISYSN